VNRVATPNFKNKRCSPEGMSEGCALISEGPRTERPRLAAVAISN